MLGGADISGFTPELMARALQAQGIWFQLLSIAEQNAAMRRRRHIERTRGRAALRGTFDHVLAEAARDGIAPQEIQTLLSGLRIRPVITAHPTESKRVTVLEKYRKIYLLLRELELPRWTERERTALIDDLRDQIELVWMTGELHLEKPTVQHEVARGLAFLRRDAVREGAGDARPGRRARSSNIIRARSFELPPFFQFGSWIGGDRDGNPSVTTERHRLDACARTRSPRCAIIASASSSWPGRCPSPSARCRCPRAFSAELDARASRQRRGGADQERAIPASPTANFSRSCCASSTPPSPASRGRISAAPARPMPMPTS